MIKKIVDCWIRYKTKNLTRNTGLENIKRKIPNAIYANTEKNVQNIVPG